MMWTDVVWLTFLTVAVAVAGVTARFPRPSRQKGDGEVLLEAREALRSVLEVTSLPYSSVLYFIDASTSHASLHQVMGEREAPFGVGVVEVGGRHGNGTSHLVQAIRRAKEIRGITWSLTVVVVSLDPVFLASWAVAADEGRLLVWATRVLLLSRLPHHALHPLLSPHWATSLMNVMIINVEAGQRSGVFVYLPFTPSGVGRTVRVASWTPRFGLNFMSQDLPFFPEKAANFHGAPVVIASNPFPPYWMQYDEEVEGGGTVRRYSGRGFMIADACARKLNYTMTQFPTSDWTEVIVVLKNRTAYFSPVTYSVMPHHEDTFSYSISIEPDTMTFAMAVPSLPPRWRSLLYPFTSRVWIFTLLAIIIFSPALLLISYGTVTQIGRGNNSINTQITVEATATLLGQNLPPRLPTHISVRVLMATWLIFGLVITISYRSNLTAYLTIPKLPPRIETLHQLISSGYRATVANDDGDDLMAYFGKSGAKDSQELSKLMYKVQDTLTGLKRTIHNKEAFVYVRVLMEAYIAEHLTGPDGKAKVYVASENISPGITAWHIIRDAFFQQHLDHCLLSLIEAGLSDRWMKEMLDKVRRESRLKQRQELEAAQEGGQVQDVKEHSGSSQILQSFTLVHMQGAFYLFFIGVTLSVLSFALESLVSLVSKSA